MKTSVAGARSLPPARTAFNPLAVGQNRMELQQLKYFVAVAEHGGFSRAAEACRVAQPSLSQQVAKLERELGQPLFDRLPRRVLLTDAGTALLERAREILSSVEDAQRSVLDGQPTPTGELRLGAIPTVGPYLLPPVLDRFRRRCPQVDLSIREDLTDRLLALLSLGELDLAVMALPVDHSLMQVEPLGDDPMHLAVPPDHPLARRQRPALRELKHQSFVLLDEVHCLGQQTLNLCREEDLRPNIVCHGAQLATVCRMVELGMGISLIPRMACETPDPSRMVVRRLGGTEPARTIAAVWHPDRYRTRAARAMVHELKSSLGEEDAAAD